MWQKRISIDFIKFFLLIFQHSTPSLSAYHPNNHLNVMTLILLKAQLECLWYGFVMVWNLCIEHVWIRYEHLESVRKAIMGNPIMKEMRMRARSKKIAKINEKPSNKRLSFHFFHIQLVSFILVIIHSHFLFSFCIQSPHPRHPQILSSVIFLHSFTVSLSSIHCD